jgi:hypothetical protein
MKKTLNPKSFPAWMSGGELPNTNVRGITKEAASVREKFRSPFGFVGPRRTVAAGLPPRTAQRAIPT